MWFLVGFSMIIVFAVGFFEFFNKKPVLEKFASIDLSKFPAYKESADNFSELSEKSSKEIESIAIEAKKVEMESIAQKYIQENKLPMGVNWQDLKLEKIEENSGVWNLNYKQYYKNILVEKSNIGVTIDSNTKIATSSSFDLYPGIELDVAPKVALEEALEIVKKEAKINNLTIKGSSLVIYSDTEGEPVRNYLSWKLNVVSAEPIYDFVYYVGAKNGSVIENDNMIKQ